MADSSRPAEHHHPVLNATRARQGRYGRHMFWVLVISTLLAAIGLFVAWVWMAPDLATTKRGDGPAKSAPAFHAPQPAPTTPP